MIVDCHAHVFAHWIGACGHPSRDTHKRYLQRIVTRTDVLKLRGLYFNVDSLSRHGFPWPLDAPQMEAFWDKLARLGAVLCIEFSAGPSYDMAGYMAHIAALGRVLARCPGLPCTWR